jgi:enediyne biosynthesis protein E4
VASSLVWIADKYPSHRSYSEASAESILGERLGRASLLQANTLSSMVFLNRGGHFEPIELPPEAQFAPAYGVTVADFDGDGFEDVFLSQNFFATEAQVPRLDAGRGLLLRGNGTGKLTALPGQESGLLIYGEQRGAAVSDFNEDGRVDLVVTQNGAATRLFINVGAKPGLRVRLHGPPSNPTAVGATVRLRFGDRLGPAREVHAGSGYYSQDSPVLVLGTPQPPTGIVVRWPGGATTECTVPSGAKAITLEYSLEPRKSSERQSRNQK